MFKILAQLSLEKQPPIHAEITDFKKLSSKVTAKTTKQLPPETQDILTSKDLQVEVEKGDASGKIIANTDLQILQGAHYRYLVELSDAVIAGKTSEDISRRSRGPAGEVATKKHVAEMTKHKITLFNKEKTQISPMKLVALFKATALNKLGSIGRDQVVVCGSGHWIRVADLEGDHAFPDSTLVKRFFYVFGKKYATTHKATPLDAVHEVFKAQTNTEAKESKALLLAHFLDAKNLMPLCSSCNGNKNKNYLSWFINHPQYGIPFISAHFPLKYDTIIPRTKDGQGLGDAAMTFLYTNQAIQLALFPIKKEPSRTVLETAKEVVTEQAQKTLSEKELAQFQALLAKIN